MLALYELNPPVSFVHYTLTNFLAYTGQCTIIMEGT